MGMFSSLFGSAGSDKADKLRQQALDAFDAIKTPDLSALQVQLQKAVIAGTITPEQAEASLLNSNAFNDIRTDPSLMGAQKQALQQLQDTANAGGLDAIDKSKLQDITDTQNQENKSANEAILANARARGMGNSNLTAVSRLIAEQGAADRAAKSGTDVAAQAQARALAALQAAGQLGGSMEAQQYGEQAQKAQAQNAIDQFNAANKTDLSKFNVANNLSAQGANVANAQNVENANTATQNAQILNNANANQTVYQDDLAKAQGKAGVLNGWANSAQETKDKETGANLALTGGLINGASTALGYGMAGPAGGAVASTATPIASGAGYNEKHNNGTEFTFSDGGKVPDPSGSLEDEYHKFVQNFCNGGTVNMADGGKVQIKPAKKSLPINPKGQDWTLGDDNNEPIGNFKNYADAAQYAEKVRSKQDEGFSGEVPGTAPVPGDSPANDIVDAKLSPGEVVIPRSVADKIGDPLVEALKRLKQNPNVAAVRG